MKLPKENLENLVGIINQAESFKPFVRTVLDVVKLYGDEIEEIPKRMSHWLVQNRIESIKTYEEAGFSRNDAITMTLDDVFAIRRLSKDINKNKK